LTIAEPILSEPVSEIVVYVPSSAAVVCETDRVTITGILQALADTTRTIGPSAAESPLRNLAMLADGGLELVGRRVSLWSVTVESGIQCGAFTIRATIHGYG
jgi:hypothetical protein